MISVIFNIFFPRLRVGTKYPSPSSNLIDTAIDACKWQIEKDDYDLINEYDYDLMNEKKIYEWDDLKIEKNDYDLINEYDYDLINEYDYDLINEYDYDLMNEKKFECENLKNDYDLMNEKEFEHEFECDDLNYPYFYLDFSNGIFFFFNSNKIYFKIITNEPNYRNIGIPMIKCNHGTCIIIKNKAALQQHSLELKLAWERHLIMTTRFYICTQSGNTKKNCEPKNGNFHNEFLATSLCDKIIILTQCKYRYKFKFKFKFKFKLNIRKTNEMIDRGLKNDNEKCLTNLNEMTKIYSYRRFSG
jgi:hypothetical protein